MFSTNKNYSKSPSRESQRSYPRMNINSVNSQMGQPIYFFPQPSPSGQFTFQPYSIAQNLAAAIPLQHQIPLQGAMPPMSVSSMPMTSVMMMNGNQLNPQQNTIEMKKNGDDEYSLFLEELSMAPLSTETNFIFKWNTQFGKYICEHEYILLKNFEVNKYKFNNFMNSLHSLQKINPESNYKKISLTFFILSWLLLILCLVLALVLKEKVAKTIFFVLVSIFGLLSLVSLVMLINRNTVINKRLRERRKEIREYLKIKNFELFDQEGQHWSPSPRLSYLIYRMCYEGQQGWNSVRTMEMNPQEVLAEGMSVKGLGRFRNSITTPIKNDMGSIDKNSVQYDLIGAMARPSSEREYSNRNGQGYFLDQRKNKRLTSSPNRFNFPDSDTLTLENGVPGESYKPPFRQKYPKALSTNDQYLIGKRRFGERDSNLNSINNPSPPESVKENSKKESKASKGRYVNYPSNQMGYSGKDNNSGVKTNKKNRIETPTQQVNLFRKTSNKQLTPFIANTPEKENKRDFMNRGTFGAYDNQNQFESPSFRFQKELKAIKKVKGPNLNGLRLDVPAYN